LSAEAKQLLGGLEVHYTPRHSSWLYVAGIKLAVPVQQCLSKRMSDRKNQQKKMIV